MNYRTLCFAGALIISLTPPLAAQPSDLPLPAAASTILPPGISVRRTALGDVYVDARGRTLYGMDRRMITARAYDPLLWCAGPCAAVWETIKPPAGTPATAGGGRGGGGQGQANVPDWTMIEGPNGPQLIYKQLHLVYVRKDDVPGSTKWDGAEDHVWNVLRYIPPVPKLVAPATVVAVYVAGAYAMTDKDQRVLYTQDKPVRCVAACATPVPFRAGSASLFIGDWTVSRSGDVPQWLYRGKPVFVSQGEPRSVDVPSGAAILRP